MSNNDFINSLSLGKRDCNIKMEIIPYGGGWTTVLLDIQGDSLRFDISNLMGGQLDSLLRLLYHLYPSQYDPEDASHFMEVKYGVCSRTCSCFQVVKVVDDLKEADPMSVIQDIPWKGSFTWVNESQSSEITLERNPDQDEDFNLSIHIETTGKDPRVSTYEVPYRDVCYAVAKACTQVLKDFGIFGYHNATYTQDLNFRHLIFLKSVALGNFQARELVASSNGELADFTDLEKELALILFDM